MSFIEAPSPTRELSTPANTNASSTKKFGERSTRSSRSGARASEEPCSQTPVGARALGTSLLRNLEPRLGAGLNWEAVLKSLRRVQYEGDKHRVSIAFLDGTRMEQT